MMVPTWWQRLFPPWLRLGQEPTRIHLTIDNEPSHPEPVEADPTTPNPTPASDQPLTTVDDLATRLVMKMGDRERRLLALKVAADLALEKQRGTKSDR